MESVAAMSTQHGEPVIRQKSQMTVQSPEAELGIGSERGQSLVWRFGNGIKYLVQFLAEQPVWCRFEHDL